MYKNKIPIDMLFVKGGTAELKHNYTFENCMEKVSISV